MALPVAIFERDIRPHVSIDTNALLLFSPSCITSTEGRLCKARLQAVRYPFRWRRLKKKGKRVKKGDEN